MTCGPKLHVPHKKWAQNAGLTGASFEEQNYLAIERWAREFSCDGGSAPRVWCTSDSSPLAAEEDFSIVLSIDDPPDHLLVIGQYAIVNGDTEQIVSVASSLSDNLGQYLGWGVGDYGFTWPVGASRSATASCVITGSTELTMTLSNTSPEAIATATLSLQAIEVTAADGPCCIQAL